MHKNEPTDPMNQAIADYYRCPEILANCQLAGRLSAEPGYFCFGPETICYGNSASGFRSKQVTGPLYDALPDVTTGSGTVRLPLDPHEIIENLRHERYRDNRDRGRTGLGDSPMVQNIYYWLRPFLPVAIRKHLQRARLSDWKNIPFPHWPVDRTVELILERLLALSMKAQGIHSVPFVWFWPDSATSCAIMTHDVEQLAGRNFCSQMMDLDDSAGIKSSFQIVPEERYPIPEKHGLTSFLVHPDYVIEKRARTTYQALLEHLAQMRKEQKIWIALPCEVDRWWRERSQMTLTRRGDRWEIEGPGQQRARIAYAHLEGGGVVYHLEAAHLRPPLTDTGSHKAACHKSAFERGT